MSTDYFNDDEEKDPWAEAPEELSDEEKEEKNAKDAFEPEEEEV